MHQNLRRWTLVATVLLTCLLVMGGALAQSPNVTTDKEDYSPGETVIITGSGFSPNESYAVPVVRPDNSIVKGDGSFTPGWDIVTTDESGGFVYHYILDGIFGTYNVRVYASDWAGDLNEAPIASTTFTDAAPHDVRFATSVLPSGVSITVNWNKINNASKPASGSTTFTSPGPSSSEGTLAGSTFSYSGFPSSVTVGSATYNLVSTSPASPFTTGAAGGTTTVTATYVLAGTPPSITQHPTNQNVTYGVASVSFTAAASGTPTPTVKWQLSTNSGTTWSDISGAINTTYTINSPTVAMSGNQYRAVFTNTYGSATTNAATLIVEKATPTITWNNPANIFYGTALNGTQLNATASVPGSFVYTPAAGTVLNAGDGQTLHVDFTPTDNTNYNTASKDVTINVLKAILTVTADNKSKTYGDPDPPFTFTYSGFKGSDGYGDIDTQPTAGVIGPHVSVGSYTIACSGGSDNNYTFNYVNGTLTITKLAITVTADAQSKTYGDADPTLTYSYSPTPLPFGDSFSGSLSRAAGENVNSYAITQGTLSLSSNYTLTYVGANLTITVRAITVTADAKSKTYGDADPTLTYQITSGSLAFSDVFTGSLTRVSGEDVGSYAIQQGTLALNSNYNLTYIGANLAITKRPITVTADAKTKVYGEVDPALTYALTSGSLVNGDGFSGSLTREAGNNVGSYAIQQGTLTAGGNYELTYVGASLIITQRPITVTANAQTKIYGNADPTLTYALTSGSLVNGDAFSGSLSRTAGENVGTYAILKGTLTAGSNYNLTYIGANLTITVRAITVTADAKSKVYGNADPALTYQITSGSLAFSDAFSGSLTRAVGENVGSYAIQQGSLALNSNYALTFVGANLTITIRAITVTAEPKTKVFGTVDPPLTFTFSPTPLPFSDSFSGSLDREAGENVSSYAILQGTLALSSNYNLTYVGANLTITKATTTTSVTSASVQYSDQATLVVTVTGVNQDAQNEVNTKGGTVAFSINGTALTPQTITYAVNGGGLWTATAIFIITKAPGTYTVVAAFTPASGNVSGSSSNGTLTVNREDASATYSGATYFSTASPTSYTASVTLSATVKDMIDGFAGNITNAKVQFRRDTPTGTVLGTADLPVGLVNPADPTVGTATTTFNYTLTGTEKDNNGVSFDVYVVVNGYYTGVSELEVITITVPGTENVSGGGHLVLQSSSGQYAGAPGSKNNFGFTMKYNKSGKNLKGQANIIVRSNGKIYQIKSNAVQSLAIISTSLPKLATFTTKANMKDITDPLNPRDLGGNLTLQVDMTDAAQGGQTDQVGITVWNSAGGLYFSSNWNGTKTVQQLLGGGNISVRGDGTLAKTIAEEAGLRMDEQFIPTEYALFQNYPNPFNPETNIQFDLPEDSHVRIAIFDLLGRTVMTLVDESLPAGRFTKLWNGQDQSGQMMASGIYFFRIEAKSTSSDQRLYAVKRMTLLK